MNSVTQLVCTATVIIGLATQSALAGDCTGVVVGVRPISQYNHETGNGFLALRSGPGSSYNQLGEVYLNDEYWVSERRGNWVYIGCMSGHCVAPPWGPPYPEGWAYAKYLSYGGVCP